MYLLAITRLNKLFLPSRINSYRVFITQIEDDIILAGGSLGGGINIFDHWSDSPKQVGDTGQWRDMASAVKIDSRWLGSCKIPGKQNILKCPNCHAEIVETTFGSRSRVKSFLVFFIFVSSCRS